MNTHVVKGSYISCAFSERDGAFTKDKRNFLKVFGLIKMPPTDHNVPI